MYITISSGNTNIRMNYEMKLIATNQPTDLLTKLINNYSFRAVNSCIFHDVQSRTKAALRTYTKWVPLFMKRSNTILSVWINVWNETLSLLVFLLSQTFYKEVLDSLFLHSKDDRHTFYSNIQ